MAHTQKAGASAWHPITIAITKSMFLLLGVQALVPHLQINLQCSSKTSSTRLNTLPQPVFSMKSTHPQIPPFARSKLSSKSGLPFIHLQGWPTSNPPLHLQWCKPLRKPKRPFTFQTQLFQSVLLTHFLSLTDQFSAILPSTATTSFPLPPPDKTSEAITLPGLVTPFQPS